MLQAGITLNADASPRRVTEIVRHAEQLGFEFCYLADQGFTRDVWVSLTAAALGTDRIRLGPGVTNSLTRSVDAAIGAVRSLRRLAGDRFFLGWGVGGSRVLKPLRLSADRPLRQLEAAIRETREQIEVPLHVAGRGLRVLELGGRLADEVFLSAKAFFELPDAVAAVRRGAGQNPRPVRIHWACHLATSPRALELIRRRYGYTLVDSPREVRERIGLRAGDAEAMLNAARKHGLEAAAKWVTDAMLREFVVMEPTPDAAAERIASIVEQFGFDSFVLPLARIDIAEEQLEFVHQLLPTLRAGQRVAP